MNTPAPRKSAAPARAARRRRRIAALGVFGLIAFAVGAVMGSNFVGSGEKAARRFVTAWNRGDYRTMYAQLTPTATAQTSEATFAADYRSVLATATATSMRVGRPRSHGSVFRVPVTIVTRIFGTVHGTIDLPMAQAPSGKRVAWRRDLTFPGLTPTTHLRAVTKMPTRGTILAGDGTVLARGADRSSAASDVSAQILGTLGPIPPAQLASYTARGIPADTRIGVNGLERILDSRLLGRPGGSLRAGHVVLAHTSPKRAKAVRTTISIPVERAAILALANRLGGVVAIRPRSGQIIAFAGIAFSSLQPPGSTFKIITTTGALQAHITTPATVYPYQSYSILDGVKLNNANGENCGGTLAFAFATSCNSVFAPLGAKLGASKLVAMAERFGFNKPSAIAGVATSALPQAGDVGDDLAVGSSAIGQGVVQATTLQMGLVATTIALHGRLPVPTLIASSHPHAAHTSFVVSPHIARQVKQLMIGVVREGTGVRAAIPGVTVAGKTGTAELHSTQPCPPSETTTTTTTPVSNPENCANNPNDPALTDAWFTSFAPADKPRIAVCVMLVMDGAGGDTAAPAARDVLLAGLKSGG